MAHGRAPINIDLKTGYSLRALFFNRQSSQWLKMIEVQRSLSIARNAGLKGIPALYSS